MNNSQHYDFITQQLRTFFKHKKGYIEVSAQSRLSILAACEDPRTITSFTVGNTHYPLPQTGQMWLEYELLQNPDAAGFFCIITSYRNEPNIIPGRHNRLFPLFEFESKGGIETLKQTETELLEFLGFNKPKTVSYDALCTYYGVPLLEAEQELLMQKEFGNELLLEKFPERSDPFWNMKRNDDGTYNKVDAILYGMETIGSAERSCNKEEMRHDFLTVSNGNYAQLLFEKFGEKRVMQELDEYFTLPMIQRCGGGIGITRLERAMQLAGLLNMPTNYITSQPAFTQLMA